MTQPVWPVQCSGSSPASFSGRNGLPALPKMLSTKSRFATRLPGAKKRTSSDFSGVNPATSGQTIGRSSSETKHSAWASCAAVNGRRNSSLRRLQSALEHAAEDRLRHRDLVVRHRQAAFGDVEDALRGAPVAAGIVQHALLHAIRVQDVRGEIIARRRQRQRAGEAGAVEDEGLRRQPRERGVLEVVVEKRLDAVIGRRQVIGQQPAGFALVGEQGFHALEIRVAVESDRRAAEGGEFEIDVAEHGRVSRRAARSRPGAGAAILADFLAAGRQIVALTAGCARRSARRSPGVAKFATGCATRHARCSGGSVSRSRSESAAHRVASITPEPSRWQRGILLAAPTEIWSHRVPPRGCVVSTAVFSPNPRGRAASAVRKKTVPL